jgi:hypothetical protein
MTPEPLVWQAPRVPRSKAVFIVAAAAFVGLLFMRDSLLTLGLLAVDVLVIALCLLARDGWRLRVRARQE